tara:strand:+ start:14077 stop:14847 length:771 start_codon:yes stop_codon:yes gene_type:complete
MLRPRIIPCLLVRKKGLVKTEKFKEGKYVGDPINAVKIFNEKEVDELMIIDIDATSHNTEPDFDLIKKVALESRMPLCYGGGVKTADHVRRIVSLGAEKVAVSSVALENINVLKEMCIAVGSQSVVVVIDIKKKLLGGYQIVTHNAKRSSKKKLLDFIKDLDEIGIGEIVINSVDNDGMMKGYDFKLLDLVRNNTNTPISILGGAGHLDDIQEAIDRYGIIGAAAGSLFVFKGKYKAVLINYPSHEKKSKIINQYL